MDADEFLEGPVKEAQDTQEAQTLSTAESSIIEYLVEIKSFENNQGPKKGDAFGLAFLSDTRTKIYLMLFSCDIGTRDRKGRIGSQNGPKHFIENLQKSDEKLVFDKEKIALYYIGNLTQKYLHRSRFQKMITNVLDINNQIYVGIGGSDDFVYYYTNFLYERIFKQILYNNPPEGSNLDPKDQQLKEIDENIALVHFDSKIDMFGTMDEITSINYFQKIFKLLKDSKFKTKVVFVGIQSMFCPSQILDEIDYNLKDSDENDLETGNFHHKTDIVWLRKNIRTLEPKEGQTQAGLAFTKILDNLKAEGFTNIEVSFDLSVLKAKEAPGRSDI